MNVKSCAAACALWYASGMDEEKMTVPEAAAALGVDVSTIRRRLQRGDMRGEHIHRLLWLIPQDEVERWRQIGRQKPGPKPKRQQTQQQEPTP